MAEVEDSKAFVKIESPVSSPNRSTFAQTVGQFAFKSPDRRDRALCPKKEESEEKPAPPFPSFFPPLTEEKPLKSRRSPVQTKTEIIDVDQHPSPFSSLPGSSTPPPVNRRRRRRKAEDGSDSEFHDDSPASSPGPSTGAQSTRKKRSLGGKPRSKKKARPYAEPETYGHLNQVPDVLGTHLEGEPTISLVACKSDRRNSVILRHQVS